MLSHCYLFPVKTETKLPAIGLILGNVKYHEAEHFLQISQSVHLEGCGQNTRKGRYTGVEVASLRRLGAGVDTWAELQWKKVNWSDGMQILWGRGKWDDKDPKLSQGNQLVQVLGGGVGGVLCHLLKSGVTGLEILATESIALLMLGKYHPSPAHWNQSLFIPILTIK